MPPAHWLIHRHVAVTSPADIFPLPSTSPPHARRRATDATLTSPRARLRRRRLLTRSLRSGSRRHGRVALRCWRRGDEVSRRAGGGWMLACVGTRVLRALANGGEIGLYWKREWRSLAGHLLRTPRRDERGVVRALETSETLNFSEHPYGFWSVSGHLDYFFFCHAWTISSKFDRIWA